MALDQIGPILQEYIAAAADALTPTPGRIVEYGPSVRMPWDECCAGQLWSRVVTITPILGKPTPGFAGLPCDIMFWQVTAAIAVIRCIHTVDDQGTAPTPEQIQEDGQKVLDDLQALQQVLLCNPRTRTIIRWTPFQASGGCGGGEWEFTFRTDTCPC